MIRETNHKRKWRDLFEKHHPELTEVAEILLDRSGSPEQILQTTFADLEYHPFHEPFAKGCAVRAVVKAAIAYNYTSIDSWILTTSSGPIDYEHAGPQPLETLPWAERAAYFLHEVLHYSRRDTALLLGISDTNVDQLTRFARNRMGIQFETLRQTHTPHPSATRAVRSTHSMAFASYE
jgi:Sigma-70, region 4